MKIELMQLKLSPSLSQETTAYTAVIHIDGNPAFHARNHGHGGGDEFDPIACCEGPTLQQVDHWLANNEPPSGPFEPDPANRTPWDCGSKCDLELLVARLIDRHESERRLRRLLKTSIVRIGDDRQVYKLAMKPTPTGIAAVKETHADWVIVNGASPEVFELAVTLLSASQDNEESVFARQRANQLTLEDARWLRERNNRAEHPSNDLDTHLTGIVDKEEERLERYRSERQAEHAASIAASAANASSGG